MRFYLIGAGVISRTHADTIMKLELNELVTIKVADPNEKVLQEFADRYPEALTFTNAEVMLSEEARKDDVVIIATPPFTHFELVQRALRSGRHALCEKPLVMNEEEADQLLQEAKQAGRYMGCCSTRFLGLPKLERMKEWMAEGKIGTVYKITFVNRDQRNRTGLEYQPTSRWFLDRSRSGGGPLFDWGPYDIAQLNDLFRPEWFEVCGAWMERNETGVDPTDCIYDIETHGGALIRLGLSDGKIIHLHYERASCTHGSAYTHTEIEGTRGALRWNSYRDDELITSFDQEGTIASVTDHLPQPLFPTTRQKPLVFFIDKIRGHSEAAIVNEQAVFNVKCLLAMYRSAFTGKSVRVLFRMR